MVRRIKAPVRRRRMSRKAKAVRRTPKFGAWLRGARTIDVLSGPAQGSVAGLGFTMDAAMDAKDRYANFQSGSGVTTVKAVGTGVIRNIVTSKSGAYRGMGQKKILSFVQALAPEIIASSHTSPLENFSDWNGGRHRAHEGYNPGAHTFDLQDPQFIQSVTLQAGAWGAQKAAQMLGINKMLPKGLNL